MSLDYARKESMALLQQKSMAILQKPANACT